MSRAPLEADAYLQIKRDRFHGSWSVEARVMRVTQNAPTVVEPGCIVVKVRLRIPHEAWLPFAPEAVVEVPPDMVQHPITVEAADPS